MGYFWYFEYFGHGSTSESFRAGNRKVSRSVTVFLIFRMLTMNTIFMTREERTVSSSSSAIPD